MNLTIESNFNKITSIDLFMVRKKLKAEYAWTDENLDRTELRYRRFLQLIQMGYDNLVPAKDIDEFWHQHILDTRAYAIDCQRTFGYFVHHNPYAGLVITDVEMQRTRTKRTIEVYETLFNECYAIDGVGIGMCSGPLCCSKSSCSSGKCCSNK
jgi:hypothetical protein